MRFINKLNGYFKLRRLFFTAAVVIVFMTVYSLILPAITMENKTYCGMEEHTHTEACYSVTSKCVCGQEEVEGHEHTDDCYTEEKILVCELEENEEHTHTDDCYETESILTCRKQELAGHTHDDSCFEEEKTLICGTEEHIHSAACFVDPNAESEALSETEESDEEEDRTASGTSSRNDDESFNETDSETGIETAEDLSEIETSETPEAEETEAAEDELPYPAFHLSGKIEDGQSGIWIEVTAEAPEGVLPEGTALYLEQYIPEETAQETFDSVLADTVTYGLLDYKAVRIRFIDPYGMPVKPEGDVKISVSDDLIENAENTELVCIDDHQDEGVASSDSDPDAALIKIDEKLQNDTAEDTLTYVRRQGDPEILAVCSTCSERTLEAAGDGYRIIVNGGAKACIPQDASLEVKEIRQNSRDYDGYVSDAEKQLDAEEGAVSYARFFDITIVDAQGWEIHPKEAVDVRIVLEDLREQIPENEEAAPQVVHFNDQDEAETVSAEQSGNEVCFAAEGFSVYGVVYTVDFHWTVDGKTFECSIPGGGFVTLGELLEVLGIAAEPDELTLPEGNETAAPLTLEGVSVSDATREFLADIAAVEFSDPDLVDISKADTDTTVGQIREKRGLTVQYSRELTEEQRAAINNCQVKAGDWALISLHPFTSEEKLTVTMKNGDQFAISVTDHQISTDVLTVDGNTFCITVRYDDTAGIPVGTWLVAEEIDQRFDAFVECVARTLKEVNRDYFEEQELLRKGVDPDSIQHVLPVSMDQARFFHVTLMYEGREIEPKTPVQVDIRYVDGLGVEGNIERIPGVSHFTDGSIELISEITTETDADGRIVEFEYTQNSFSDIGTFIGHEAHDRRMAADAPNVNLRSSRAAAEIPTVEDFVAENGAPDASKVLADNKDGTYTLALNVTPRSSEYTKSKKSNVLFIMDRSSSMDRNSGDSYLQFDNEADALAALNNNENVYGNINGVYTPLSYLVNDYGGGFWTSASGIYDTSNGLYYGLSGSRFSQEQAALGNLINQLMVKNAGQGNENNVEISVISFATYAGNEQKYSYVGGTSTANWGGTDAHKNDPDYRWGGTEVGWTGGTDTTPLINGVNEPDMARGTNWEEALRYAKDVMDEKKRTDGLDEEYYVIFLTDGAPTATTWSITQHNAEYEWGAWYGNNGGAGYQNNQGIPYAYEPARDDALALVGEGYKLYNIFTYGEGTDYNYLIRLTNYAYSEGRDDTATENETTNEYFKNATNTAELVEYFNKILKDITINGNIGHSQVKIKDGLTTGAMTSTFMNGKPSAVHYSVTPGQGSAKLPYTVQVTMPEEGTDPVVTFTINGQEYSTTSGAVQKKVNPADAYDAGEYYSVKVGSEEYKIALASVDNAGELTWDLTPMGVLWDNCDYKAEFVVWPKQEAYNYVAGLNNKMPGFSWDEAAASQHEHTDSQGRKYWSHGVSDYPSIVKYEDGTFAVLTNTHQEVEYSVSQVENGALVEKTDPKTEALDTPDPMPLTATRTNLEKQWNVDRNPAILAQYLYNPDGTPTEFVAKFDITSDNDTTPFATVSLGWDDDLEQYVWDESSLRRVVYAGHVFHIGTRWSDEINIATGLMLSSARMQALGLNPAEYPKAVYEGKTYYILERGHDYHVEENPTGDGLGYEFDFLSPVFHPMLVDGRMVNIVFEDEMNEDGPLSLTVPYPISSMVPAPMNAIGSLVVENTLRGYINVEKIVVDKDGKTKLPDDTTKFSYDVVLDNEVLDPAPFTVDDSNVPWYGINGLFYHAETEGTVSYYEAAPLGGNRLSLLTESGETVIAETEGQPFNKDVKGPTKIRLILNEDENQYGEWFDLYGNEMFHDSDSHVHDTIQIMQGQILNIANVPKGTTYTISESILNPDYDLMSIVWGIRDGDETITSGRAEDISSGSITGTIVSNRDNHITFTNKIHSADVIVKKVDGNGKGLLGAKFTLTKAAQGNSAAQTWTLPETGTADTGKYMFADLSDGIYTLTETPPANYTGIDPITFVVTGGKVYMPGSDLPSGYTLPGGITWPNALPAGVLWTGNTFTLTVPNTPVQPPAGEVRVEKRWVDENGDTAEGTRDVRVQLRRRRLDSHKVTVVFHSDGWSGGAEINDTSTYQSIAGDQVIIEFAKPTRFAQNDAPPVSSTSGIVQGPNSNGDKWRIVVSGVSSDITVTIDYSGYNWQLVNQNNNPRIQDTVTVTGNGQGSGDYIPDENFPAPADLEKATKTLTAPDYFASWKFGEGNSYDFPAAGYQYYIVELDENGQPLEEGRDGLVSITNNDGITTGIITATNKIDGSLTLKKQITALSDDDVSNGAGKYNFTVTGPGESGTTKHVQIRIDAEGTVTYKIADAEIGFDETEGFVSAPADGTVLIRDLVAGTYKVTEGDYLLDSEDGKYTTSLGKIEVESGTADLSAGSATLDVRAENTPSAAAAFTNMLVPMVDVPVLKTWKWEDDDGKVASWTATFNLEYREVLVSGEEAEDAKHSWAPMYEADGTTQKSVTLRSTDSPQEKFTSLPMYKTHENGSVYRMIYAVDEVAYTITYNDGRSPETETWSKSESGHLTEHYSPDYEQDAGESEMPENPEDWDEWYTISLKNVRSTKEIEKTIDLSLEKVWEDETLQNDPDSMATFQLMRTYHEEFLDYDKLNLDPDDLVTVKLVLGDGVTKQMIVPRGAPVYVTAAVKPGKKARFRFRTDDSSDITLSGPDEASTSQQFIRTSESFAANADGDEMTVTLIGGDTSVLVGDLDGLGLASFDPADTTSEQDDEAFNNPMSQDGQSAGQEFTLDAEHGWRKEWAGLPQVVEELSVTDSGTRMKTIVYSYYLKEIEDKCYPKNYKVSFRNGMGDMENPLISSGTVVAENSLETTELHGTKTWNLDGNSSYVLGTPVLKLTRRTEGTAEGGTTLSEPEDVTVNWEGEDQFLQPTWHSDGAFTRSYTYAELPKRDKDGKTYVYSVEEIEFTVGSGENAVVYTAARQPDGSYIVTPDKEGAEKFVVTQTDNDIVNTPLKVADLKIRKQVTINDFDPANSAAGDKTKADGTYVFQILGKAETPTAGKSYTVKIVIDHGTPVSATLRDNTAAAPEDTAVTLTADKAVVIPDLIQGVYTVTEAADTNTVLTALNSTQTSTAADLDHRSIEITLNGEGSEVQTVTATNNAGDSTETDIAHISVRKTFKGLKPGHKLPDDFHVAVTVTGRIDGATRELEYTLRGETDTTKGVIWNETVNDDGDMVWNWRIAVKGLNPDATVNIQEYGYKMAGYDVDEEVNGTHGTAYSGTVSPDTTIQGISEVITEQNSLEFPLNDLGPSATIFIARIIPSQTALVISKNRLNLSERAALEQMLRHMPNAQDWYKGTTPRYYSFEDAANNKIHVRSEKNHNKISLVTYSDDDGGKITFSEQCDWNMVACRTIIFKPGRPADFNYVNSYVEHGVNIDLLKVDQNNRDVKLPGARFTVTKLDESSTISRIQYKLLEGTDTPEFQRTTAMTNAEGMTSISGLTSGYYEVRESQTPDGYVLTGDECFYVKIEDGVAVYLHVSENEETTIDHWLPVHETASDALIQVTNGRADDPETPDADETVNTLFSIGNTPGVILPHTGGPGTGLLSLIGLLLTGIASVVLLMRKRKTA